MERKVLKVCALGLCATTVFIGGPKTIVNAQEVNGDNTAYTENVQNNAFDKSSILVDWSRDANYGYLNAMVTTTNGPVTLWSKKFKIKYIDENTYWGFRGEKGADYYYLNYNGKLYALDLQTGEEVWSVKCDYKELRSLEIYADGSCERNNFIDYLEVDDKLIEFEGRYDYRVVVYDVKTGKVLKSIKNVKKKYIESFNKNGWEYDLRKYDNDSFNNEGLLYLNDTVYIRAFGKYNNNNNNNNNLYEAKDSESTYLKLDVKNYKVEFLKSHLDLVQDDITDKNVVTVSGGTGKNKNGEVVWSIPNIYGVVSISEFFENVSADNKNYYIGVKRFDGSKLYAIDMQTGGIKWIKDVDYFGTASVIEVGNKLVVVGTEQYKSNNGYILVYDKETGNLENKIENIYNKVTNSYISTIYTKDMSIKNNILYIPVDNFFAKGQSNEPIKSRIGYLKLNINTGKIGYDKISGIQDDIPEKKVVDVKMEETGNFLYGLNNDKKIVWSLKITKPEEECDSYGEGKVCSINYGTHVFDKEYKYAYSNYNGKLYAFNMQTGERLWVVNSSDHGMLNIVGDKLVKISLADDGAAVVYDTKTGKVLKTVNNIKKYVPTKYESVGYIGVEKIEDGKLYFRLSSIERVGQQDQECRIGYLVIDANNYKIKFVADPYPYSEA